MYTEKFIVKQCWNKMCFFFLCTWSVKNASKNAKIKALDMLLCCQGIWCDDPDVYTGLYPLSSTVYLAPSSVKPWPVRFLGGQL